MIRVAEPSITLHESSHVQKALASGWVSANGDYVEKFEELVAKACGRSWCVATVTGTAALHAALVAAGVQKGVSVQIPTLTYIATANAVRLAGGRVTLIDRDPYFPNSHLMRPSSGLAICDAAPSIGSRKHAGRGWMACLSFNGNKIVTTGQGGAVVGNDMTLYRKVRSFVNVEKGREQYNFDRFGMNYGMSNVSAALGVAQMERLTEFLTKKHSIMDRYNECGIPLIGSDWMAVTQVEERDSFIEYGRKCGIEFRPFWKPVHLQPPYRDAPRGSSLIKAERMWQKLVCLPCSVDLTREEQDRVIEACGKFSFST
jgi:perosamine synthetase